MIIQAKRHNVVFVRDDGERFVEDINGEFMLESTRMDCPYRWTISLMRALCNRTDKFREVSCDDLAKDQDL